MTSEHIILRHDISSQVKSQKSKPCQNEDSINEDNPGIEDYLIKKPPSHKHYHLI